MLFGAIHDDVWNKAAFIDRLKKRMQTTLYKFKRSPAFLDLPPPAKLKAKSLEANRNTRGPMYI